MKKRVLSLFLMAVLLCSPALAQVCMLCGGDGVCDACEGKGYVSMQAYGSAETVKIACTAGCADGKCPQCNACEVCGGLGYVLMQAYGSNEQVKVVCTAAGCSASGNGGGLPQEEAAVPAGTILLVSPAEYADGRVFFSEDETSWDYSTTGKFDINAYIDRLCADHDMSLKRINDLGDSVFYDLSYRHLETGKTHTLSLYTFTGGQKYQLTLIKPLNGGIALPEFIEGAEPEIPVVVNVPNSMILMPSPAQYANDKVYLDESSSSWMYSTSGRFDMDAYIRKLESECGMKLDEVSTVGSSVFYDMLYTDKKTGKQRVPCMYTFTSNSEQELSIIKPNGGGVTLPEFYGQEAVMQEATAKPTAKPTLKPVSNNRFENAMESYLKKR